MTNVRLLVSDDIEHKFFFEMKNSKFLSRHRQTAMFLNDRYS